MRFPTEEGQTEPVGACPEEATNKIRELVHLFHEDRLRQLVLFSVEKRFQPKNISQFYSCRDFLDNSSNRREMSLKEFPSASEENEDHSCFGMSDRMKTLRLFRLEHLKIE
ncbi:hypothetical protein HGM15179_011293 [Zosterops borbonicus]|uniref:Uncharacterized protein n=1 Tax=Zosterops borbonicus TaxID=364589 RepID=A0A8K1GBV3_9PASS|nr:hypothetical protein HGM15179_011293 [Zosterops borbonicus]